MGQLKQGQLLDAAHIIGDREGGGDALVTNGLTLCKIHHASYDTNMLGISPDYTVHINHELLQEAVGLMLKHGIQEMDRKPHDTAPPLRTTTGRRTGYAIRCVRRVR